MDVNRVKELLPIFHAFSEGREIEYKVNNASEWQKATKLVCLDTYIYRIKPEPKYRPFRTQEECWKEMHKHPDFGWVIYKGHFLNICDIGTDFITICPDEHTEAWYLSRCISEMAFTDNTPFGIKEE